jgi:hypothetical protein
LKIIEEIKMYKPREPKFVQADGRVWDSKYPEIYSEHKALGILLLLPNSPIFLSNVGSDKDETVGVYLMCSDTFYWGCADGESLKENDYEWDSDIIQLFDRLLENPKWGDTYWVCLKRWMRPQRPLIKMMKEAGAWTDEMENLPVRENG